MAPIDKFRAAARPAHIQDRTPLPMNVGSGEIVTFSGFADGKTDHFAVIYGQALAQKTPIVRVHSECVTGDVFGSLRCDCGEQLQETRMILSQTGGIILYLRQEGRGIGLAAKIRAYTLQDQGLDTLEANTAQGLPADGRDYTVAAQMLRALGKTRVRMLTNNLSKIGQIQALGIEVTERLGLVVRPNAHNRAYLKTKAVRMGHLLPRS